nr:MAG TPA: peptidase [Caudoviricetes sp.]
MHVGGFNIFNVHCLMLYSFNLMFPVVKKFLCEHCRKKLLE